jgi:hypothetical protein
VNEGVPTCDDGRIVATVRLALADDAAFPGERARCLDDLVLRDFFAWAGRNLTVFGKGGKVRYLPVVDRVLRLELEPHILDRQPQPDEFLLFPEKAGPEFYGARSA